jgi:N-acetyl-1-D-myo-inositol-2-amino-2-deoxy-alpha-D-glucopyranoside deacetylase
MTREARLPPASVSHGLATADLRGQSVLAVFAHPDDESLACGGLLAGSAQAGAHTSVLCLTRGAGVPADAALSQVRTRELQAACAVLGVRDVLVLDHDDGYLPWVDTRRLQADVAAAVKRVHATVVITFDEDGLYWHPDHVAVHEHVRDAIAAMGAGAPSLFYVTMPAGRMRALVDRVVGRTTDGAPHDDVLGISAVDAFGAQAPPATYALDVAPFAVQKLRALRCHATQAAHGALALVQDDEAALFLGIELYRRANVGHPGPTFIDNVAHAVARGVS